MTILVTDAFWVAVPAMIAAITGSVATIFTIATARKTDSIAKTNGEIKDSVKEVAEQGNHRWDVQGQKLDEAIAKGTRLEALVAEMTKKADSIVTNDTLQETMRESIKVALEDAKTEKKPKGT